MNDEYREYKTEYKSLLETIYQNLNEDIQVYRDLYNLCREGISRSKEEIEANKHPTRVSNVTPENQITSDHLAVRYLVKLSEKIEEKMRATQNEGLIYDLYDLHRKVLLKAAPYHFESYCLYLEWNRDPARKFYVPRRKALHGITEALQELQEGKIELLSISTPPGCGKNLSNDTPVFTSEGWKNHGDLVVGDKVIGFDGRYKTVEHVFPKETIDCEVEFTNGDKIKCHENHEWYVYDRASHKEKILTTKQMMERALESGVPGKRGHHYVFFIPSKRYMEGEKQDLPVDPYVLGVWLGDGTTKSGSVTLCDTDHEILFEMMKTMKYGISSRAKFVGCTRYHLKGLRADLQKLGMCHSRRKIEKFIPEIYQKASAYQRLRLLAGLIDTDGALKCGSQYSFSTINENLRDGVIQLINSFGWRFTVDSVPPRLSSSGIQGKHTVYRIRFTPSELIPVKVPRKKLTHVGQKRRIAIKSIRRIEPVEGNCIQVEGGLYCAGKTMVPTHNSTMAIFFLTWMAGKYPNEPMLTGSHSNAFIRGMYDEVLRVLDPNGEYLWGDVFPGLKVSGTNAKDCRIDVDRRQRFETLEFTSIGSGNSGLYRASTLLYCDDLISGIEEALSKERLDKLWNLYTTDLRQRKIGDHCRELHIATRWSVHDVIGRLEREYGDSDKAKFITLPAMDENDESNFDYDYGVGFSTEFYRQQRDIMDDASWRALYMNIPIEREGLLYPEATLKRYLDLPEDEPDAILAVCDTKDRGKDYCVMPVIGVYGGRHYLIDTICDNSLPEVVEPRLAQALVADDVQMVQFESNSAGGRVAQNVDSLQKEIGGHAHVTTKFTTANKETKIIVNSGWVKENIYFPDESLYSKQSDMGRFMDMLCTYTVAGKNPHDDVPDAIAQYAEFYQKSVMVNTVEVFRRPF